MESRQSMDEQFIEKVEQAIAQNLDNDTFTVEQLAQEVGLSRSMLHRKLVRLTGTNASEMISHRRLACARQLLENNEATVSETAYKVGFKNPSYFNKAFKRHYNIAPGELRRKAQNKENNILPTSSQNLVKKHRKTMRYAAYSSSMAFALLMLYMFIIHPTYQKPSIAVLPLENLTGNTDNEYLLSGVHHALIGELGRLPNLRVISHESTRYYKSSKMQNADIAAELNVRFILSGSVLSVGDSIHLILELSNTRSKNQLMNTYEYHDQLAHIISMQKAVAQKVARSLRTRLSRTERLRNDQKQAINPDVYKAYLRGMYALHQGSEQWYEKGIAYMEEAIKLDPGDPYAYAGLALGYATLGHGQVDSEASFLHAVNAANKAIKLDPSLTEAYTALALLHLYHDWNWSLSNASFKKALKLNPNNAIAHAHYAWYYILFDDMDAAIKHAKQATYLEPLSPAYHAWLGLIYCHYGNYDKAEKAARKALTLNNTSEQGNLILGWCNLHKKQFRQANTCYDRLPKTPHWETMKAYCYVQSNQKEKALEIWYRFKALEKTQELSACYMGLLAACLGFNDRAFEYLNTAIESRMFPSAYLNYFPHTENIRKDPRYALLMQKIQLDYIPE